MDSGKSTPRSHVSGVDGQPTARKPRKTSKKNANAVGDGRVQQPAHQQHLHEQFPLFNNRSLSMLSTMHHLNPHRKVAMSPEILREAEEQATSLRKAVKQLQEQLEKTNREKARLHRFLSDLLYTLNARGYESVRDHEGTLVDLNKCKGETYLDLKGRDLKQRVSVRRPGGQEFLLKAVIGNQERAIQSLVYKLDSIGRDILLGNRLSIEDSCGMSSHEGAKIASLEAEVVQLVNLIEGACQKCPEIYPALRDHYYLLEGIDSADLSPRNPVIQNLLKKCEQLAGETQSRQLVDMLNCSINNNSTSCRSKSQQLVSTSTNTKPSKTRSISKTKSSNRTPRAVSSDTVGTAIATTRPALDPKDYKDPENPRPGVQTRSMSRGSGSGSDGHLKRLNGPSNSKSENSFYHNTTRDIPIHFPRTLSTTSAPTSGGDPVAGYFNNASTDQQQCHDSSGNNRKYSVCPYCNRRFGIEESVADIKSHIEMHVFNQDPIKTS